MNKVVFGLLFVVVSFLSASIRADVIGIQQYSGFLYSDTLGPLSLEYTDIGYFQDDFTTAGLSASFQDNLDAENLGTVAWSFTNETGGLLENTWFFAFLDAEFDQFSNTFFNESGEVASVTGSGAGDNLADSWEIDEPGYLFGDIFDHVLTGALDNSNAVPAGLEDDVSLALGFNLGDLVNGANVTGLFELSRLDIGGLAQTDADSPDTLYFNGTVDVVSSVPEPSIPLLLAAPLLFLFFRHRRNA
ncbi:MAG: hypothetical protein KZQ81_09550 [Candidatus Thiodiazotropha sp. (ex Rostrolucina anterorostrata)]|nr:hypothetical protein [Candidatus Thiodiazotropha sp. (ex Rostrolucina anterorostrata)]